MLAKLWRILGSRDNFSKGGKWFFNGEVQVTNKHFTTAVEINNKNY
jgi:hypothetical protein